MWTVAVSGTKQCRFSFENGVVWTGPKRGQLHFFLGGGGGAPSLSLAVTYWKIQPGITAMER